MPLQTQQRTLVAIPHYNYGSRPSHVDNDPSAASIRSQQTKQHYFNQSPCKHEASPWLSKPRRDSEFHLSLTEAEVKFNT
uniref:Uncharacterized protein n=1 Tax=Strigamia maritima TaxID=126957 RepID=T1IP57_STRMM